MPTMGIVLPVYNERSRIGHTFAEVKIWAHRRPHWRFLFVDDGSQDGSDEEIERLLAEHPLPNIALLRQATNGGKGLAIKNGFAKLDTDLLCFTDGDLAYSLDHLDRLEAGLAQYDVVIGNRNLVRQHENTSLRRRVLGFCFNRIARLGLDLPYRDTQAGLKGFRAATARAVFGRQRLGGFGFDAELLCIARRQGYRIGEIPARVLEDHNYKIGKVKLLKDSLQMMGDLFRIRCNLARGQYD